MNTIEKFKDAMLTAGITPPDLIVGDGQLHRFKIDGKLNGAYVLHMDSRPAGYFQDFKQGIKQTWKQSGKFMPLSEFQRQALEAKRRTDEIQRQREEAAKHKVTASKAAAIWNQAKPALAGHPYLIKKCIGTHGARIGRDNTLIIPLYDANKELVNLQFISETGGKRFLSGGKKKACFYSLGEPTDKILICEGFATGASLYEDSGYLTVIAFDAGNLEAVAQIIRQQHSSSNIIVCGDNDFSGVGQEKARQAALACNGKLIIPPKSGYDFNDMRNMEVEQ